MDHAFEFAPNNRVRLIRCYKLQYFDFGAVTPRTFCIVARLTPLRIAALILIIEPKSQQRIDPDLVARTLRRTPAESQVAVRLAEGKNVRDIARATRLTEGAIYWHRKQIYQRLPISRQVDLVRLVLSIAEFGEPPRYWRPRWALRMPAAFFFLKKLPHFFKSYQSW